MLLNGSMVSTSPMVIAPPGKPVRIPPPLMIARSAPRTVASNASATKLPSAHSPIRQPSLVTGADASPTLRRRTRSNWAA